MDGDRTWGIKINDELNNLIRNKNISNHIMAQRLSWFGHEHLMTNDRWLKNYTSGNWYLKDWQEDHKLDGKISEKIQELRK